jgi:hypothetical protein
LHPAASFSTGSATVRTAQHALPHLKRRISTDIVTGRPKQDLPFTMKLWKPASALALRPAGIK